MIQHSFAEGYPLSEFWSLAQTYEEIAPQAEEKSEQASKVSWMVENRGGLAKLAGLLLLPAQVMASDYSSSRTIIERLLHEGLINGQLEKITIPVDSMTIVGLICYPKEWKREDTGRCVVYHNPNGMALVSFFKGNRLSWTPHKILERKQCPLILYDYRGVGINREAVSFSSLRFLATYESIVADGQAVTEYALKKFGQVEVIGTSLGGAIAAASLERHLAKAPLDARRVVQLVNHDSFTTSPRVILPNQHLLADFFGWTIGAKLDAVTPMVNLIKRNIKIKVIYQTRDPMIPFGARMGDYIQTLPKAANVTVFASDSVGHGNMTAEMAAALSDE